jgi:uncharacterized RDD family membrane protein YckC
MNCPSCGLLNLPSAPFCLHCQTPLGFSASVGNLGRKVILVNPAKGTLAAGSISAQPENAVPDSNWREQLTLKLERLKEKNNESSLATLPAPAQDFRDREFVKPGKAETLEDSRLLASVPQEQNPLAEKLLQRVEKVGPGSSGDSLPSVPVEPAPSLQEKPETPFPPKRKRAESRSGRVERIEINLNQCTLPFESNVSQSLRMVEDQIQPGLTVAPIGRRVRAGLVDAVFVFGCFLIFLLIVFFVPDFAFLTKSSLVGMGGVWLLIFSAYMFLFTTLGHQTLGMNREDLQIVNFQGVRPSFREAGLRCFGYVISLGCFCLGFLWALFDPDRLTWHDKMSKTFVVQTHPTCHS